MANVDAPRGLIPVASQGAAISFAVEEMTVDASNATAIFRGDLVKLEDDGNAAPAAAGNSAYGVCVGVVVNPAVAATIHPGYLPATTAGTILVIPAAADILYEIQEDSDGGSLALTAVGSNVDIVAGAGSTVTGLSAHEIDSSSSTDGAPGSAQLRIVGLVQKVDNEVGTNARWLVRIVENQLTDATGL